jgi:hypothetical protein
MSAVIQPLELTSPSVPGGAPLIILGWNFLRGNTIALIVQHVVTRIPRS